MTVARSVSEVLGEHVTLTVESIDRLYLNLYVPIRFCSGRRGRHISGSTTEAIGSPRRR